MATSAGGSSNVVAEARRYPAGNPRRAAPVGARFMNMVLERTGLHGMARTWASFARYGSVCRTQIGAIAVMDGAAAGMSAWSAASTPVASDVVSGNNATRSGKRQFRRGGFSPTSCRRTEGY